MVDMPPGEDPRRGRLALGGPFLDDSGGMMVAVPAVTRQELEEDPAVKSGLLRFTLRPWLVGMTGGEDSR